MNDHDVSSRLGAFNRPCRCNCRTLSEETKLPLVEAELLGRGLAGLAQVSTLLLEASGNLDLSTLASQRELNRIRKGLTFSAPRSRFAPTERWLLLTLEPINGLDAVTEELLTVPTLTREVIAHSEHKLIILIESPHTGNAPGRQPVGGIERGGVMIIYNSVADFNAAEGAQASEQGEFGGPGEADWAYRLRGEGAPGGKHGWMLTFLFADKSRRNPGWLIAYEIDEDAKTGRVALLRRGWTQELDNDELKKARKDPEWDDFRKNEDGEADINYLDRALAGQVIR